MPIGVKSRQELCATSKCQIMWCTHSLANTLVVPTSACQFNRFSFLNGWCTSVIYTQLYLLCVMCGTCPMCVQFCSSEVHGEESHG